MKDWYFTITYIKVQNNEETIVTEQPTYVFREYTYAEDSAKKCIEKLRLQNATNQLDNTARIKEVRKNIARIQTVITAKAAE